MFSLFENLISISLKMKSIFSFQRMNSPSLNLGKRNIFIKQGFEVKPRSRGPYLLIKANNLVSEDKQWVRFNFDIVNFGSEPANNTQTYTEIYFEIII